MLGDTRSIAAKSMTKEFSDQLPQPLHHTSNISAAVWSYEHKSWQPQWCSTPYLSSSFQRTEGLPLVVNYRGFGHRVEVHPNESGMISQLFNPHFSPLNNRQLSVGTL